MRTCYLHAGMPKTGSTSIQNAFCGFKSDRIRYAELGQSNHGPPLICSFSDTPQDYHIYRYRGLTDEQVAGEVERHTKSINSSISEGSDVIFSSEGIVDHLKPHEIKAMAEFLNGHFDRVQVIIYVRPLASLATSHMQQQIKHGLKNFKIPAPLYRKRFQPLINHFRRKNVQFVRFSRTDLIGGDIVRDFAERVGVEVEQLSSVPRNKSWSLEAIATLYAFNKKTAPQMSRDEIRKTKRALIKKLSSLKGRKFELPRDIIENHIEKNREPIEWAESVCGFDVRGTVKEPEYPIRSEEDLLKAAIPLEKILYDASEVPQVPSTDPSTLYRITSG